MSNAKTQSHSSLAPLMRQREGGGEAGVGARIRKHPGYGRVHIHSRGEVTYRLAKTPLLTGAGIGTPGFIACQRRRFSVSGSARSGAEKSSLADSTAAGPAW